MKRGLDIATSAVLLLLALPSLLIAALVIRVTSPGPILFRQIRMGRHFRPFEILKLRTMEHAAKGELYTLGRDPRITWFGRFLRRSKLDEVPQLWNVLRGEMSLVGPRPVLPELTEEFWPQYVRLLKVRPGLTDPASLKYSQEARLLGSVADPMRYFKSVVTPDKIAISLRYVERANLWTDGMTLALTALICCLPALSSLADALAGPVPMGAGRSRVIPWPSELAKAPVSAGRVWDRGDEALLPREMRPERRRARVHREPLPWNPVWTTRRGGQSTAHSPGERVSRL